jgi:hypothetical protein
MFYWTAHFYDDFDFLEYKNKERVKQNNTSNKDELISEISNSRKIKKDSLSQNLSSPQKEFLDFKFNESHTKNKNLNINNNIFKNISIYKFDDSFVISETNMSIIMATKI